MDILEKETYGVCGPSVISLVVQKTTDGIIENWSGGYSGFATRHQMIFELKKYGYKSRIKLAKNKCTLSLPDDVDRAIARIQWYGEGDKDSFAGWGHWTRATQNTHYILMQRYSDNVEVYCNNEGWFMADNHIGRDYLKDGFITSFIAV